MVFLKVTYGICAPFLVEAVPTKINFLLVKHAYQVVYTCLLALRIRPKSPYFFFFLFKDIHKDDYIAQMYHIVRQRQRTQYSKCTSHINGHYTKPYAYQVVYTCFLALRIRPKSPYLHQMIYF